MTLAVGTARRRRRGPAARPLPRRRHPGPGRRRPGHRALLQGHARRRAGALRVVAAGHPGVGPRRGVLRHRQRADPQPVRRVPRVVHPDRRPSCCWPTCPAAGSAAGGGPYATTRCRPSWPASTWAGRGSRRSWSARPPRVPPARCWPSPCGWPRPSGSALTLSLTLLAAVVLGGLGSLTGALVGAALLTFLPSSSPTSGATPGLSDIKAAELAPLVYGAGDGRGDPARAERPRRHHPRWCTACERPAPLDAGNASATTSPSPPTTSPAHHLEREQHHETHCSRGRRPSPGWPPHVAGARRVRRGWPGRHDDGDGEGGGASDVGITDDSITIGAHFPLTGVAAPGLQRDPDRRAGVLRLRQRRRAASTGARSSTSSRTTATTRPTPARSPTSWSSRTRSSRWSAGSAPPPTAPWSTSSTSEGVPDLFVSSGSLQWGDDVESRPYHVRLAARLRDRGQDHRPVRRREHARRQGRAVPPGRRLRRGRREGRAPVPRRPDRRASSATRRATPTSARRSPALQAAEADLVLGFNTPSYTALSQLVALKLGYEPQWYYSNVGSDPHAGRLAAVALLRGCGRGRRQRARRRA